MRRVDAARAYQNASRQRGLREQEADVFHRVNAALRAVENEGGARAARAVSDNNRLWIALVDNLRDPTNALPPPLRASIISVGLAVQREGTRPEPDIGFLVSINEQIAAGLSGR